MHILIDAYNLIKKIYSDRITSKDTIKRCIERLIRYSSFKNHVLTIIFDGGDSPWPTKQDYSSLCCVWWVGYGAKADDFIKKLLEARNYQLLVSCDRELVLYAQDNKIPSIEVAYFWEFVEKALNEFKKNNEKSQNIKSQHLPNLKNDSQTIDELMSEFAFPITTKDGCDEYRKPNSSLTPKKHLSKLQVQLYTIIKKL